MRHKILWIVSLPFFLFSCAAQKETSLSPSQATDVKSCLLQGSDYLKTGETEKAIAQLKNAVLLDPNSSQAHNLLGVAYFQRKAYKQAEEQILKAIDLNPAYSQAYNNLGSIFVINQEYDKAKNMFEKAISLSPDIVSAQYGLGTLYVIQGELEEGLKYLSKGMALDPEFLEKNKSFINDFSSRALSSPDVNFMYAKLFASVGNIDKTVYYLDIAKGAGFRDWQRIEQENEFANIKDDPRIKEFVK